MDLACGRNTESLIYPGNKIVLVGLGNLQTPVPGTLKNIET